MTVLIKIRVAECPPVWEIAAHSVYRAMFRELCQVLRAMFWFEGGLWDLIKLIPDHCSSLYFD